MLRTNCDQCRAELGIPFFSCSGSVLEVHLGDILLILAPPTRHSKGAPLCGYTGVTRKVRFKLRPKDTNAVFQKCRAPKGNKNRENRGINFEKTE